MTYPTKAAQKRALDDLNAQYSRQRRLSMDWIQTQCSELRQLKMDELYFAFPMDLHLVKDRHLEVLPADQANAIRSLVAARQFVKEQGVSPKAPTKVEVQATQVERRLQANPVLTDLFQGEVKASTARDLEDNMVRRAGFLLGKHGSSCDFSALIRDAQGRPAALALMLRDRDDYAALTDGHGAIVMHRIRRAAAEEAQAEIDNILPKMALKLGRTLVDHGEVGSSGRVEVTGYLDGHRIRLIQTRVLKTSPLGKPFFQYPATLYVDGRRMPEAEFARMADAS
jgi:hypothetical protein